VIFVDVDFVVTPMFEFQSANTTTPRTFVAMNTSVIPQIIERTKHFPAKFAFKFGRLVDLFVNFDTLFELGLQATNAASIGFVG